MDGMTLKLVMMLLMVLDHLQPFIPRGLYLGIHVLTRCVAPFFAFMAVEGFLHTRSRRKYLLRLLAGTVVMFAGNHLLNNLIIRDARFACHANIFATLFSGVAILWLLSSMQRAKGARIALYLIPSLIVFTIAFFMAEGGFYLIPFMLIAYYCRGRDKMRNALYLLLSVALFAATFRTYPTVCETLLAIAEQPSFLFITVIPFLSVYNGKRGNNTPALKYSFYVFYPAHLWIITATAWLIHR